MEVYNSVARKSLGSLPNEHGQDHQTNWLPSCSDPGVFRFSRWSESASKGPKHLQVHSTQKQCNPGPGNTPPGLLKHWRPRISTCGQPGVLLQIMLTTIRSKTWLHPVGRNPSTAWEMPFQAWDVLSICSHVPHTHPDPSQQEKPRAMRFSKKCLIFP